MIQAGHPTVDSTRPDDHHDPSSFGPAGTVTGHSRGTAHRAEAVSNGHGRSIKPQVNGHMAPAAILDVEEVRPWRLG
jgi:hypothetical protein